MSGFYKNTESSDIPALSYARGKQIRSPQQRKGFTFPKSHRLRNIHWS